MGCMFKYKNVKCYCSHVSSIREDYRNDENNKLLAKRLYICASSIIF